MLKRFALILFCTATPFGFALAEEAKDQASTSVEVAPQPPVDPIKKRAEEIDRLFAQLQQKDLPNAGSRIAKIWTLWSLNQSPTAELLLAQSDKALRDGAYPTAETMLNTVLGAYPDYTEALNKRAMVYFNQKRYDEAMTDLDAVLEQEPRHFGALAGRAAVFNAKGQFTQAAGSLKDALAVNPYLETAKEALQQLERDYPNL
jgi:tetratricopeptide (TPR) repeat protein